MTWLTIVTKENTKVEVNFDTVNGFFRYEDVEKTTKKRWFRKNEEKVIKINYNICISFGGCNTSTVTFDTKEGRDNYYEKLKSAINVVDLP